MTSPVIVLVADASPRAGLGHLSRSTAVAHALSEIGAATDLLALGAAGPVTRDELEWRPIAGLGEVGPAVAVVLDGYELDREAVAAIAAATPVVWFDDHGDAPARARLVVAPAIAPPPAAGRTVLTGLEHAALGRPFWDAPERRTAAEVGRVLVTMGGTDASGTTAGAAAAARRVLPGAEIAVVRGPHAEPSELPAGITVVGPLPGLADELAAADVVVGAAGQTMLEAAAVGTPSLVAVVAPNQAAGAAELERRGAVRTFDPSDPDDLHGKLAELAADRALRERMAAAARAAVDGQGARRVARAIERLGGGG